MLFLASLLNGFSYFGISQQKTPLQLTDIFDMEYVSGPQVSPDGNRIAYVRHFKDIMTDRNLSNLWLVNSDGSGNRPSNLIAKMAAVLSWFVKYKGSGGNRKQ